MEARGFGLLGTGVAGVVSWHWELCSGPPEGNTHSYQKSYFSRSR